MVHGEAPERSPRPKMGKRPTPRPPRPFREPCTASRYGVLREHPPMGNRPSWRAERFSMAVRSDRRASLIFLSWWWGFTYRNRGDSFRGRAGPVVRGVKAVGLRPGRSNHARSDTHGRNKQWGRRIRGRATGGRSCTERSAWSPFWIREVQPGRSARRHRPHTSWPGTIERHTVRDFDEVEVRHSFGQPDRRRSRTTGSGQLLDTPATRLHGGPSGPGLRSA